MDDSGRIATPSLHDAMEAIAENGRHPYSGSECSDYFMSRWMLGLSIDVSIELMDIDGSE